MIALGTLDLLMLFSLATIWLLLLINMVLTVAGYRYYLKCEKKTFPPLEHCPMVSVLVPAHNEAMVIGKTVESLLRFDYPADRYEIIVVNDNSSDNSADILAALQARHPRSRLKVISTDAATGGKGKSRALNIALAGSVGEIVSVYDADNTPETPALRYLVTELMENPSCGAVIGKFRTRNKSASLLTRFINIETLAYQWMAQAGRWQLLRLVTIPGTNYVIRRSILEQLGGWDEKALAEDTEVSFRVYLQGFHIRFMPLAVTWEQEPQSLRVWFRQRSRWVQGNLYVLLKNLPLLFDRSARRVRFDLLYFLGVYLLLLAALVLSDFVLLGGALGWVHTSLAQFSILLWVMAILLFIVGTYLTITTEKGEMTLSNLFVTALMYFTYSKLWMVVALYGLFRFAGRTLLRRESTWHKTERFDEGAL